MIHLTRINGQEIILNSDRIEWIEATPDTVLTLSNAQKLVVRETAEEVVARIVRFRRSLLDPETAHAG